MDKMNEIKQTLMYLCDVIYSAGMDEESEEIKKCINFLYEALEDRTNDIIHLSK